MNNIIIDIPAIIADLNQTKIEHSNAIVTISNDLAAKTLEIISAKEEAIKQVQGDEQIIPGITDIVAAKVIDIFQYLNGKLISVKNILDNQQVIQGLISNQIANLATQANISDLTTTVNNLQTYVNTLPSLFSQADIDLKNSILGGVGSAYDTLLELAAITVNERNALALLTTQLGNLQALTDSINTDVLNQKAILITQNASLSNQQSLLTSHDTNIVNLQNLLTSQSTQLTNAISAISALQTSVNSQLSSLTSNLSTLQTNQNTQGTTLTTIQNTLSTQATSFSNLQTKVNNQTDTISSVQSTITSHTTNITTLQTLTNSHDTKLNTLLNTTIPGLSNSIALLNESLSTINGTTLPSMNTAINNRLRKDQTDSTNYNISVAAPVDMSNAVRKQDLIGGITRPVRVFNNVSSTFVNATIRPGQSETVIDSLNLGFVWTILTLRTKVITAPTIATTITIKSNGSVVYTQTILLANIPAAGKVIDLLGFATSMPPDITLPAIITVSFSSGTFQVIMDGILT